MERHGIERAYTSLGVPGAPDRHVARACNDYAAELAAAHRGRFGVFASLPLPDVDAALTELDRVYDDLGADGVALLTSYGDLRLGDREFARVFDALDERHAIVHVHPTAPPRFRGAVPHYPDTFLEFPFDTTRAFASLVYGGTLARCPRLTLILAHGGGAVPMLSQRLAAFAHMNGGSPDVPAMIARLHVDAVTITNAAAFAATTTLLGPERILFGTDFPYVPPELTVDGLAAVAGEAVRRLVERDNALRIGLG